MTETASQSVRLAVDRSTPVIGKGVVPIKVAFRNGEEVINLENTLCVPELKTNLLSVSKIVDKNHKRIFL